MSLNDPRKYKSFGNEDREHSPAENLSEREKKQFVVYDLLFISSLLPMLVIRFFYSGM